MKKQIDFNSAKEERLDQQIKETLQRDFPLPQQVEEAKKRAFAQIRERESRQKYANEAARKTRRRKRLRSMFSKGAAGLIAAAACFSVICIANPALAANIPLVGHIFERVGQSLGFSGDYSKYAAPLTEVGQTAETEAAGAENETEKAVVYKKTVDGVTVTLSEIYCNDVAMNIGMLIESEKPFPETMEGLDEKPVIELDTMAKFSYNPEMPGITRIDGKFLDEYTFAGVLRTDLRDTLNIQEYGSDAAVPEDFTVKLDIDKIIGVKPDGADSIPAMPQEFLDEYHTGLEENGLGGMDLNDPDIYENLTDEQKQIEHELFTKMQQEYAKRYPEAVQYPNEYEYWWYDGPWNFDISVKKNHEDTIVKEIKDIDENGLGVVSVTKTPFEITVETQEPDMSQSPSGAGYFVVALDADGDIMPYGSSGRVDVWAIQDRDISRIDIYLCDYIEYMDELKGYYWSDTYETDKETKTFKQLLDERSLHHTEVVF